MRLHYGAPDFSMAWAPDIFRISKRLNGDVGEIVRDFTEISRATGDDADADESNEQAYAELVEFIRVAAQVVFEELLPLRRQVYPAQQRLH